jgi:hypothetical protein
MPHKPTYWRANLTEQMFSLHIIEYKDDWIIMAFDIRLK